MLSFVWLKYRFTHVKEHNNYGCHSCQWFFCFENCYMSGICYSTLDANYDMLLRCVLVKAVLWQELGTVQCRKTWRLNTHTHTHTHTHRWVLPAQDEIFGFADHSVRWCWGRCWCCLNSVVQTILSFLITISNPLRWVIWKKMGPLTAHVSTVLRHS